MIGKDIVFRYLSRYKKLDNLKIDKKLFFKEIEKISGILSYLLKENMEAKFFTEDKKFNERIVVDKIFDKRYEPDKESIKKIPFCPIDFLENRGVFSGLYSFSDFIKFKIIKVYEEGGVILNNKVLIPLESSIPTIFLKNYELIRESKLFKKSLIKSSEKICRDILSGHKTTKKKMEVIRNIMSGLGMGEIYFKRESNIITATFFKKIFILENPAFVHLFINGFLNSLYGKKLTLIFESGDKFKYKV